MARPLVSLQQAATGGRLRQLNDAACGPQRCSCSCWVCPRPAAILVPRLLAGHGEGGTPPAMRLAQKTSGQQRSGGGAPTCGRSLVTNVSYALSAGSAPMEPRVCMASPPPSSSAACRRSGRAAAWSSVYKPESGARQAIECMVKELLLQGECISSTPPKRLGSRGRPPHAPPPGRGRPPWRHRFSGQPDQNVLACWQAAAHAGAEPASSRAGAGTGGVLPVRLSTLEHRGAPQARTWIWPFMPNSRRY